MPYMLGQGCLLKLNGTTVGQRLSVTPPNRTRAEVEATHLDSEYADYVPGMPDQGFVSAEYEYYPQDTSHQAVLTAYKTGSIDEWTVEFPDGTTDVFDGFITAHEIGAATVNATMTASITIRIRPEEIVTTPYVAP